MYVNEKWAGKDAGDEVKVGGNKYTIGTDAFATVQAALEFVQATDANRFDVLVAAYIAEKNITAVVFSEEYTKADYYAENQNNIDAWNNSREEPYATEIEVAGIDYVGSKLVLDKDTLTVEMLNFVAGREAKVEIDADNKGSLIISGGWGKDTEQNEIALPENLVIEDFANITVEAGAVVNSQISTAQDKETFYKAEEGAEPQLKSDSVQAAGKAVINGEVASIEGYKTVEVAGEDAMVNHIGALEYKDSFSADDLWISSEEQATGSVTVKDGAYVNEIEGYKNVTVDGATVEHAANQGSNLTATEVWLEGEWTGEYEVDWSEGNSYSKVAVSNKIDWAKKKGSAQYKASYKADGTAKLKNNAVVYSLSEFATVELEDSCVEYDISLDNQRDTNFSQTVKDIKDEEDSDGDLIQLTVTGKMTGIRGGKVTLKNSTAGRYSDSGTVFYGADITGYNTVSLTNCGAGNITNNTDKLSDSYKAIYEDTVANVKAILNEYDAVYTETVSKIGATGSVKVVVDKDADHGVVIGNVNGYATVTLTGNGDKKIVAGQIYAAENITEKDLDSVVDDPEWSGGSEWNGHLTGGTINGKEVDDRQRIAAGTLKMTDVEAESVYGYKSITLKNASIYEAVFGDNYSEKEETVYKTAKDGKVTVNEIETYKSSAAGSFTAVDSYIGTTDGIWSRNGDIEGYATVKLTNTEAGNITGSFNYSCTENSTEVYANYIAYWEDLEYDICDMTNKKLTDKYTKKETQSAAGSVTIKLDKNAAIPAEGQVYAYIYGDISNFANVTITGTAATDDVAANLIKVGDITVERNESYSETETIVENYEWGGGEYNGEINGKYNEKKSGNIAGTVKLTDAVAGNVYNYKTVTLKNAEIGLAEIVDTFTYNESSEFKTAEDGKVTEKYKYTKNATASGSFTATDSVVSGIDGYKTVKLTNSIVSVDGYGDSNSVYASINKTFNYTGTFEYASYDAYRGSEYTGIYEEKNDFKIVGSLTFALDKNYDADTYYNITGDVKDFATVKISGWNKDDAEKDVYVNGNITSDRNMVYTCQYEYEAGILKAGSSEVTEYKAVGTVTLKDNVKVTGNIKGYQKVSVTDGSVWGDVVGGNTVERYEYTDDWGWGEAEVKDYVAGDLTMSDANIMGDISGFKKVSVKDEFNMIGSYTGTAKVDDKNLNAETFDIAKKATLVVSGNESEDGRTYLALDAEDKLNVNGELIFWEVNTPANGAAVVPDDDNGDEGDNVEGIKLLGDAAVAGKGKIYANSDNVAGLTAAVKDSNVTVVDLGDTSWYFMGEAEELADNEEAIVWDGGEEMLCGWVGKFEGDNTFSDDVDIIKFTWNGEYGTSQDFKIDFLGDTTGFELTIQDNSYELYKDDETGDYILNAAAGATYEIKVTRTEEGSTSYSIAAVMA